MWLGGKYSKLAATWYWVPNEKAFDRETHTLWGPGQPGGDGDCVTFARIDGWTSWFLNDYDCTKTFMYVCEYTFPL